MPSHAAPLLPPTTTPSGIWALFYIAEAVAVTAVLKRFPDDKVAAVSLSGEGGEREGGRNSGDRKPMGAKRGRAGGESKRGRERADAKPPHPCPLRHAHCGPVAP